MPASGRGTQVVRERSAKPLCVGSIPTRASILFRKLHCPPDSGQTLLRYNQVTRCDFGVHKWLIRRKNLCYSLATLVPGRPVSMNQQLRPLNLGETLDRTFQIYRSNFSLFAGIALAGALFNLIWYTLQVFAVRNAMTAGVGSTKFQIVNFAGSYGVLFVSLIANKLACQRQWDHQSCLQRTD